MPSKPAVVGTLSLAELGRATLARQHLLERSPGTALEMIEHLLGLQSQAPHPPYTGLWSRLAAFRFDDLGGLLVSREAVRILAMRGTVHLLSAADARGLRPLVQPVIEREFSSVRRKPLDAAGVDVEAVAEQSRQLLAGGALTAQQLVDETEQAWPDAPREHLSAVPRIRLPLVQVPPRGLWGQSGQAAYALLDDWTGRPMEPYAVRDVIKRYLAAFGPATVRDAQAWCGLTRLRAAFDALADELVVFEGPAGERLYDLPDAPRPPADTPAPVRILPEWDNLLLSYADRTRVIDADRRAAIFSSNGILPSTLLVDGRVAAHCRVDGDERGGRLRVRPFAALGMADRAAAEREGVALLEAMGGRFAQGRVEFGEPGSGWDARWS